MKKTDLYSILDRMEAIKKIDLLIELHTNTPQADFMISQYEAKKIKLVAELIDTLAAPAVQSAQSFSLIQKILDKFYPHGKDGDLEDESLKEIIASI